MAGRPTTRGDGHPRQDRTQALAGRFRSGSRPGYDWGAAAENLGAGYSSLNDVIAGWKASAGHRTVLLNPNVTEMGIAAVATPPGSKHRNYWALIMASPQPDRVAAGPFGMELAR